ncbi:MAG: metallophosphoesterase family protein [Oscillospiraceae bacterium]|jgi:predicted phosphodiesterase|nr:metallophosphoesterase family protein [Oscillospiraceae bacterium]
MKHAKKILAAALSACLLLGWAGLSAQAAPADKLQYRADGSFQILVFTDTHQTAAEQPQMIAFLGEALDHVKPDLVVFLGDNAYQTACESVETERTAITKILTPVVSRGYPFAFVFGNHDAEGNVDRDTLLEIYQSFPGCLITDADPALSNAGTCNLPIYSASDPNKVVQNLWFFDSGQGAVERDQLAWYTRESEALQAANGGAKVPSLVFQHIILPEIYDYFYKAPFKMEGLTQTILGVERTSIPDLRKIDGYVMEKPCPPSHDTGELAALADRGDVIAAVFGHDHVNNFVAPMRGIDLVQIPGTTFGGSYGTDVYRGATVFTLRENNPWSYEKETVTYRQLVKLPDSQIGTAHMKNEGWTWFSYGFQWVINGVISLFRLRK